MDSTINCQARLSMPHVEEPFAATKAPQESSREEVLTTGILTRLGLKNKTEDKKAGLELELNIPRFLQIPGSYLKDSFKNLPFSVPITSTLVGVKLLTGRSSLSWVYMLGGLGISYGASHLARETSVNEDAQKDTPSANAEDGTVKPLKEVALQVASSRSFIAGAAATAAACAVASIGSIVLTSLPSLAIGVGLYFGAEVLQEKLALSDETFGILKRVSVIATGVAALSGPFETSTSIVLGGAIGTLLESTQLFQFSSKSK